MGSLRDILLTREYDSPNINAARSATGEVLREYLFGAAAAPRSDSASLSLRFLLLPATTVGGGEAG